MALIALHKQSLPSGEGKTTEFGVGDTVRVHQKIVESGKTRVAIFEGMVIKIRGEQLEKSFTVRRIGAQKVGIEQIFPLVSPTIEKIEVKRHGLEGVRHAKLYYTRDKSKREIDRIYSRATRKNKVVSTTSKKVVKKASK